MVRSLKHVVKLSPETHEFVRSMVSSGRFASVDAVIANALERQCERERAVDRLRSEIDLGLQDLKAGRFIDGEQGFRQILGERAQPAKPARRGRPR